jgi:hypothetical protein
VNPILQVAHARGGQYKYNGHTINLLQDVNSIAKRLPRRIEDIDILIVRRKTTQSKHYDFIVSRSCVMNAFHYKIEMNKYYQDVEIDMDLVLSLPHEVTNMSDRLHHVNLDIDE